MKQKYKVLIIDNSAFIRQFLSELFNNTVEFEVVAAVSDPEKALDYVRKYDLDAITLDFEMPNMDRETFLRSLMQVKPTPVVLIGTWPQTNNDFALKALSLGVLDFVAKPEVGLKEGMKLLEGEIIAKVKAAAEARISRTPVNNSKAFESGPPLKVVPAGTADRIIVIGASTGGTIALGQIFKSLRPDLPGILIVQHMPAMFTAAFAQTLNQTGELSVKEAEDGEELRKGTALVTPGGKSLSVKRKGNRYLVQVGPNMDQSIYNPSINYTLFSVAEAARQNAMGVILTGMGDDGARGLRAMKDNGAYTIAQDEKSSVVYGMPQKAVEYGGVTKVVALTEVADEINSWGQAKKV